MSSPSSLLLCKCDYYATEVCILSPALHNQIIVCVFAVLLLASIPRPASAQTAEPSPREYYVGTSEDANLDRARSGALSNLVSQIQVFVSSSFQLSLSERNEKLDRATLSTTIARSSIVLKDVGERIVRTADEMYVVTKYVTKESVNELFRLRRARVLEYIGIAQEELFGKGRQGVDIGSVLKHYYWAWLLAQIHPDTILFSREGTRSTVSAMVPHIMQLITKQIAFTPSMRVEDESIVWKCDVKYNGVPVSHMKYEYYDGVGQTEGDVLDGTTRLTLYFKGGGMDTKEIGIDVDYRYQDEMDDLLTLADSMLTGRVLLHPIMLTISGKANFDLNSKKTETSVVARLPQPIQALLDTRPYGFEGFMKTLNTLVGQRRIITGNSSEFETLNGLFAAIVSNKGLLAIVKKGDKGIYDVETFLEKDLREYSGKRVVWIEVIR